MSALCHIQVLLSNKINYLTWVRSLSLLKKWISIHELNLKQFQQLTYTYLHLLFYNFISFITKILHTNNLFYFVNLWLTVYFIIGRHGGNRTLSLGFGDQCVTITLHTHLEIPMGLEPMMVELQSTALASWLRYRKFDFWRWERDSNSRTRITRSPP